MNIVRQVCLWTFLLAGAAHFASIWKLQSRIDDLADQGKLKRSGLSFFFGGYVVMLRSVEEVLRRNSLGPDRSLRIWGHSARASFYLCIAGWLGFVLVQFLP